MTKIINAALFFGGMYAISLGHTNNICYVVGAAMIASVVVRANTK